jgi:hypothetical protein
MDWISLAQYSVYCDGPLLTHKRHSRSVRISCPSEQLPASQEDHCFVQFNFVHTFCAWQHSEWIAWRPVLVRNFLRYLFIWFLAALLYLPIRSEPRHLPGNGSPDKIFFRRQEIPKLYLCRSKAICGINMYGSWLSLDGRLYLRPAVGCVAANVIFISGLWSWRLRCRIVFVRDWLSVFRRNVSRFVLEAFRIRDSSCVLEFFLFYSSWVSKFKIGDKQASSSKIVNKINPLQ